MLKLFLNILLTVFASELWRLLQGACKIFDASFALLLSLDVGLDDAQELGQRFKRIDQLRLFLK